MVLTPHRAMLAVLLAAVFYTTTTQWPETTNVSFYEPTRDSSAVEQALRRSQDEHHSQLQKEQVQQKHEAQQQQVENIFNKIREDSVGGAPSDGGEASVAPVDEQEGRSPPQREAKEESPPKSKSHAPPAPEETDTSAAAAGTTEQQHRVAGLSCAAHGGPDDPAAVRDVVYWRDIPSDAGYTSPLKHESQEQFLTMEPDEGGFNNIRMSMESAVAFAVATGRTLVLPPKMKMYRLWDGGNEEKNVMGFTDFYHFESVVAEHPALKVITFQEFLEQEAMTGRLIDPATGTPTFPPGNRTDWTGAFWNYEQTKQGAGKPLWEWLRNATKQLEWDYEKCVVGLPSQRGKEAADNMSIYLEQVNQKDKEMFKSQWAQRRRSYNNNPTPVNASAVDRLSELLASRPGLCVYDETLQNTKVVHASGEGSTGFRLLVHFYALFFFEDWEQDIWLKRFVRDHFRYLDSLQCAAARIVQQVRRKAVENGNPEGKYHSAHIRRGDFQYQQMHLPAEEIYWNNTRLKTPDGSTFYVATDEKNKTFFDPLREHYSVFFLDDFKDQIQSINPNYYGMLDQLVASRGEVFWGAFYSTFTGFINRIRGYHEQKNSVNKTGAINSYYYLPKDMAHFRERMRTYHSLEPAYWQQEWPVAWRDIDLDVGDSFADSR